MKPFLIILAIVGIICLGLYFKHNRENYSPSQDKAGNPYQDEAATLARMERNAGNITPDELAEMIGKNENYKAGLLHDKDYSFIDSANFTTYTNQNSLFTIITYPKFPYLINYFMNEKKDIDYLIAQLEHVDSKFSLIKYGDDSFPTYTYKNCIFINHWFDKIKGKYFVQIISSTHPEAVQNVNSFLQNNKLIRDSLGNDLKKQTVNKKKKITSSDTAGKPREFKLED